MFLLLFVFGVIGYPVFCLFSNRLGAHYTENDTVGTEQNILVSQVIKHESYALPFNYSNDIALLKLAAPAVLGRGVGTTCLPNFANSLVNKQCWVTGWGHLASGGEKPNALMEARIPIISQQRCIQAYPGEIDNGMMCAGVEEGGIDACQHDSGGPLVCDFNRIWYVEGVVSWGDGCGDPGLFGVYANVREFMPWIKDKISSGGSANYKRATFPVWNAFLALIMHTAHKAFFTEHR